METEGKSTNFESGNFSDEDMAAALLGDTPNVEEEFNRLESGDSLTPDVDTEETVVTDEPEELAAESAEEAEADEVAVEAEAAVEEEVDPVVSTKDGKHTIPYEVLEGHRKGEQEGLKRIGELEAKLAVYENKDVAGDLEAAQELDAEAGDDSHVQELLADLEENQPELVDAVKGLIDQGRSEDKATISELKQELTELKEAFEPVKETAINQNRINHFEAIENVHEDFDAIMETHEEGALHDFIEAQPSFTKALYEDIIAAKNGKGTSAEVIELLTTFKDATGYGQEEVAPVVEAEEIPKPESPDGKAAAEKAKAKAKAKNVTTSLSDAPSSSTPPVDEGEAILQEKNPVKLMQHFAGKSQDEIESFVSKVI